MPEAPTVKTFVQKSIGDVTTVITSKLEGEKIDLKIYINNVLHRDEVVNTLEDFFYAMRSLW